MTTRTDKKAVDNILGDNYDGSTSLLPFIETANGLVDRISTLDTAGIMSANQLELVERWLAAHFYAHHDQLFQSSGQGGANATYQGQTGMALASTQYGQTAMTLDLTGTLSELSQQAINGKRKAGMSWLGTRMKYDESELSTDQ